MPLNSYLKPSSIIFVLVLLMATPKVLAEEPPVRIMGHPVAPMTVLDDEGNIEGFSRDLFYAAILPELGLPLSTKVQGTSFTRVFYELQYSSRQIGLLVGRNTSREDRVKWVGPYITVRMGLIGKKSADHAVLSLEDLEGLKVASVKNSGPEQALLGMGFAEERLRRTIGYDRALQKLLRERVDLVAGPLAATKHMLRLAGEAPESYRMYFPLSSIGAYFAFSKDFPDAEIDRFQKALDGFMQTQAYTDLVTRYDVTPPAGYRTKSRD